jgi:hypothetical protein
METPQPNSADVAVIVEQEAANRYRVLSSQLELIGEKLRGKQRFSVFYSIILPVIVSAATLIFSSLFQYISWANSVYSQSSAEHAAIASETYNQAVQAFSKRYYATFLFLPTVRNLVNRKADVDTHLYKLDFELNQHRFNVFFDQLQDWNENYDQLLTNIDYNLDRPIYSDAKIQPIKISGQDFFTSKADCTKSLTEIIEKVGYFKNSLKAQFAAINYCFITLLGEFNRQKDAAVLNKTASIDLDAEKRAAERLSDLNDIAGRFRCHALLRIDYYNDKKGSIVSVPSVIRSLFKSTGRLEAEAEAQFRREDECRTPAT